MSTDVPDRPVVLDALDEADQAATADGAARSADAPAESEAQTSAADAGAESVDTEAGNADLDAEAGAGDTAGVGGGVAAADAGAVGASTAEVSEGVAEAGTGAGRTGTGEVSEVSEVSEVAVEAVEAGAEGSQAGEAHAGTTDADRGDTDAAAASDAPLRGVRLLEREGDLAADYLETLLDIADLDGDLDMDIEGDRATVDIVGKGLGALVGPGGETLDALQELTRLAVHRETGVRSRLMLDIGGFRARRRTELHELGTRTAGEVRDSGTPRALPAMTPFERKVVHDAVAGVDGVNSESEGEEPDRFVVVRPD